MSRLSRRSTSYESYPFLLRSLGPKLKYIARLAVECGADRFERRQPDGLGFAILEDGEIGYGDADFFGEFGDAHFAFCQHDVDVDDNAHRLYRQIVFGFYNDCLSQESLQEPHCYADNQWHTDQEQADNH